MEEMVKMFNIIVTVKTMRYLCRRNLEIFCGMWKAPFDIFHNVVSEFSHSGNKNVGFPLQGKNGLKLSTKLELKCFMFDIKEFHTQCGKLKAC